MRRHLVLLSVVLVFSILVVNEAKSIDPYKVLGVDRNASQREIQKAFHKLSLKYHPDKNKDKGAQQKFAEINNAYDILSDEDKRKNYDLYGDEKGSPGFDGSPGNDGSGYTFFTSGSGKNGFRFKPGEWQSMGGQGGSKSFSFSFGGSGPGSSSFGGPGSSSFGFGLDDIFNIFGSNFGDAGGANFGGAGQSGGFGGSRTGGFRGPKRPQSGPKSSVKNIRTVNSQVFRKEIMDQGMTWLVLSYSSSSGGAEQYESLIEEVASSLQGALKVGRVNCEAEASLCKELGIYPRRAPRLFVYSYILNDKGSFVEYNDDPAVKNIKSFCQEHLPRFSNRINLSNFDLSAVSSEKLPKVMLLSTKKETPVIWRVLTGLYRGRFTFYDAQVRDKSDPAVKKLGVDELPAIVGWLSNGEKHVLRAAISVKDVESAVQDLCKLLEGFEKKNKRVSSSQSGKAQKDSVEQIPLLSGSNFDSLCSESTAVCIIGTFRSSQAREKLQSILSKVSQKSLSRRQNSISGSRDSVSYTLLDATKQGSFLSAFDKSGFRSSDKFLIAYKRRRGKFAAFTGEMTMEEVENFLSSVLNGDVQFTSTRQKQPVVK